MIPILIGSNFCLRDSKRICTTSTNVKNSQDSRPRHPPAIEQHIRMMDPHRAFVPGQRDKNSAKDEGMSRYLDQWDGNWKRISARKDTEGRLSLRLLKERGGAG